MSCPDGGPHGGGRETSSAPSCSTSTNPAQEAASNGIPEAPDCSRVEQRREVVVEMGKVEAMEDPKGLEVSGGGGGVAYGGECVVVDVKRGKCVDDDEKVCRICHLSSDPQRGEGAELIQLGCGCKDDLGAAHRHCAEAWFKIRGNRCCEICGECAKNITGIETIHFMENWDERRILSNHRSGNSSERVCCLRGQPFCNFLMACLVIAFILPWFFRVNMF